jgi:hypothetical protein
MDSTIAVSLYICKYISIIDNDINEDKTLAICFYVDLNCGSAERNYHVFYELLTNAIPEYHGK